MAQQLGIINIRGSVGDITYVRTEDGYLVPRKSSLNNEKVMTDLRFRNTRRVMSEFGNAARAGKLLRMAVISRLKNAGDSKLQSRMLSIMMKALSADSSSLFGQRLPQLGNLGLLEGFEFNRKNELIHTLLVQYKPEIDHAAGRATITFPVFSPSDVLLIPQGATHFMLLSAACELDFDAQQSITVNTESGYYAVDKEELPAFSLLHNITSATLLPVALVLGIRFYNKVNGNYYQLHANDFNAVRIIKLDQL